MNQLPAATLADIVFEHRNKSYGAYDLRLNYSRNARRALLIGIALFGAGLALPDLLDRIKPDQPEAYMKEVVLTKVQPLPPKEEPIITPPKQEPIKQEVAQKRYLTPEVLEEAPEEVKVPTTEELKDATPSDKTVEGTTDAEVIEAPEETAAAPTKEEKSIEVERKSDEPFTVVEQQPEFRGGTAGLAAFLQKNLRYPAEAARANISGRVYVAFVVNADGSIVDAQVTKGIGFGCDEEALRVIRMMPKWRPGKQSGQPVRVRFNLPIVFALE